MLGIFRSYPEVLPKAIARKVKSQKGEARASGVGRREEGEGRGNRGKGKDLFSHSPTPPLPHSPAPPLPRSPAPP
uniref:hypothetical protein n=1 Tax=Aerosakkonema funiforme TaxID=1246630 RepID=UPI001A7ECD2E